MDLPFGPWKPVISANWTGFPVAIYANPDRVLMLCLFEKRGGEISSAVVCLKKAFATEADLSKMPQNAPREFTVISKKGGDAPQSVIVMGATPAYVKYDAAEMAEAVGRQYSELAGVAKYAGDLCEAYGGKARDMQNATDAEWHAVVGDPFSFITLFNPSAASEKPRAQTPIAIGIDGAGKPYAAPLECMSNAVVIGGTEAQRYRAMRVLLEGTLLNGIPAVVFDSKNAFDGLAFANGDTRDFTRNQMTAMPMGFPMSRYKLGSGIYVDLSLITPELFMDAFGIAGTDVGKVISKAWGIQPAEKHLLSDIEAATMNLTETPEITRYLILKAKRMLKVLSKKHPALFNRNAASDLLAPWNERIGKVFHVDLSEQPDNVNHLLMYAVLSATPAQKGRRLRMVVCFDSDASKIYLDVVKAMAAMRKNGVGFLMHAETELDTKILDEPTLRIDLVGVDAIALTKDGHPTRLRIRPNYTRPYAPAGEDNMPRVERN